MKMNRKLVKIVCILTSMILAVAMLAGCAAKSSDTTKQETSVTATTTAASETTQEQMKDPVEIKVWTDYPDFDAGWQVIAEDFSKANSDIKVAFTHYPPDKYVAVLKVAIQANEAPDLFRTNGSDVLDSFVKMDATMDLDGKIDVSMFDKNFLKVSVINDNLYATPGFRKDLLIVYYNKDIFNKNSIGIPKSYDEFISACEKLKTANVIPIAYGAKDTVCNIFAAYTVGPSILTSQWYDDVVAGKTNFKNEKFIKTLSIIKEFADKGYYGKMFKGVQYDGAKLTFSQGKAAMIFTGSWDNAAFKQAQGLNYGAFFFPPLKAGDPTVGAMSNEAGLSIYSKTKNTDQAIKFAQYCTSVKFYELFCNKLALIPPLKDVKVEEPIFKEFASANQWIPFYFVGFNKNTPTPQDRLMDGLQAIFNDTKTVNEVVNEIQESVDRDFPELKLK